jgi:Hydroxymethylglutaryl-CoA reductase
MINGRGSSRRYYHNERQPPVFFFIDGKTYTGKIIDFSRNGIGIVTPENPEVNQGDYIPLMYLGKPESEFAIKGLKVAQVTKDGDTKLLRIGIFAPSEKTETQLNEIIRSLTQPKPAQISGNHNHQKIPYVDVDQHYSEAAVSARLNWARGVSGATLHNIEKSILDPESLSGNIENYIGAVQIPVGLAGPILVNGIYANDYVPIPIATTEGALVSSINRGARVCNEAGGINVAVTRQSMVRAPVFFCEDMHGAINLERWIQNHFDKIRDKANSVTSVGRLTDIETLVFGASVTARFRYTTGDAAGQNMTTACTWFACEWLIREIKDDKSIKYVNYLVEGNMSGDKKANAQNFVVGRGTSVTATIHVPGKILRDLLRIDPDMIMRADEVASASGLHIGILGYNCNFANVIAGVFAATGQDIASVSESALGIFKPKKDGDGLTFDMSLPSLVIGTVGGGTKLPTQRDCLELMGCYGPGKLFRFAEILAATCLALDISTSAAICANEFVMAHERLGRNRPVKKLTKDSINRVFLGSLLTDQNTHILSFKEEPLLHDASIITKLLRDRSKSIVGLFRYRLTVENGDGRKDTSTVLKLKPADHHIIEIGAGLARLSGEDTLPGLYESQDHIFGFNNSNRREVEFYRKARKEILRYVPKIYGSKIDGESELFAILMEDLSTLACIDSATDSSAWDDRSIKTVLNDLAGMHSVYFNDRAAIPEEMLVNTLNKEKLCGAHKLLRELTDYNARQFPEMLNESCKKIYVDFLDHLSDRIDEMYAFPMTLTHNDFNSRNICLRNETEEPRLVIYDWELACYQNPQHDLIEFLAYVLPEKTFPGTIDEYAEYYRSRLEEKTGLSFSRREFHRVLYLNAIERGLVRFNLYLLSHNIIKFDFVERVYGNLVNFIISSNAGGGLTA